MPAHHSHAWTPRQPALRTAAAVPQRLPVSRPDLPPEPPIRSERAAVPPLARPTARDLAAAVEPAFVPARGDAAVATVRDRIATELVKAHDLSPSALPPGRTPDLDGSAVRVTAARLPAAPLAVKVPFAGVNWTALLQRTEWSEGGRASLVYELHRDGPDRT